MWTGGGDRDLNVIELRICVLMNIKKTSHLDRRPRIGYESSELEELEETEGGDGGR